MNRAEFEMLLNITGKVIEGDLVFSTRKDHGTSNYIFDGVHVQNTLGWEIVLNGTYKPEIPSLIFNFVVKNVGPICRLCVNGMIHKNEGRTHKHDLKKDSDPRNNLPEAIARRELHGLKPSEIWQTLCQQANIIHNGQLVIPGGEVAIK